MTCFVRSLMSVDGGSSVRCMQLMILSYKVRMTCPTGRCFLAHIENPDVRNKIIG